MAEAAIKEIKLQKEMYQDCERTGESFSAMLERFDPSPEGSTLDAFERQLKNAGIVTAGRNAVALETFFKTYESAVLFPEYVDRQVRIGMLLGKNQCKLADIVAVNSTIDASVYRAAYANLSGDFKMRRIAEGARFPEVIIAFGEQTITLRKVGMMIKATYEALRRVKLPVIATHLKLIGNQMAKDKVGDAISIAINGDGNSNAATVDTVAASGTLAYSDLVDFDLNFDPYESKLWIGPKAVITLLLNMTEFKNPLSGMKYQETGEWITPLGNLLKRNDTITSDNLLGMDKDFCIEQVNERGANLTEHEKIIDGQWENITISEVVGFAKIHDAARVLDINHP